MARKIDAKEIVLDMLRKGWRWSEADADLLLHPGDHNLFVRYDREMNTLNLSPGMEAALERVIPTPEGRSRRYWPDEQKAYTRNSA